MKKFDSLYDAAEFVVNISHSWKFNGTEEYYNREGLIGLADAADGEDPVDEDSFYLASSYGSIGFCSYEGTIDWLFLSQSISNEKLPLTYESNPSVNFCPRCGNPLLEGAIFCGNCGSKI